MEIKEVVDKVSEINMLVEEIRNLFDQLRKCDTAIGLFRRLIQDKEKFGIAQGNIQILEEAIRHYQQEQDAKEKAMDQRIEDLKAIQQEFENMKEELQKKEK
jgi:signal-transduction protein with cAMP-binding, CBS, and nucleotidyltransferase domain